MPAPQGTAVEVVGPGQTAILPPACLTLICLGGAVWAMVMSNSEAASEMQAEHRIPPEEWEAGGFPLPLPQGVI